VRARRGQLEAARVGPINRLADEPAIVGVLLNAYRKAIENDRNERAGRPGVSELLGRCR